MRILQIAVCLAIVSTTTVISGSCSYDRESNQADQGQIQQCSVSKETAILIAKGMLFLDYELTEMTVNVTDDRADWKVHFLRKNPKPLGGDPTIWINKKTGEVSKANFAK